MFNDVCCRVNFHGELPNERHVDRALLEGASQLGVRFEEREEAVSEERKIVVVGDHGDHADEP